MSDESASFLPPAKFRHLDGCAVCADLTRPVAYRWLGISNWIPALHSVHWVSEDVLRALDFLEPAQEIELDYRGDNEGAPRIAIHRSLEDVVSASGPAGWLRVAGQTCWNVPPSINPDRDRWLSFMLLSFLKLQRGAEHLVLVEPEESGIELHERRRHL